MEGFGHGTFGYGKVGYGWCLGFHFFTSRRLGKGRVIMIRYAFDIPPSNFLSICKE